MDPNPLAITIAPKQATQVDTERLEQELEISESQVQSTPAQAIPAKAPQDGRADMEFQKDNKRPHGPQNTPEKSGKEKRDKKKSFR